MYQAKYGNGSGDGNGNNQQYSDITDDDCPNSKTFVQFEITSSSQQIFKSNPVRDYYLT